MFCIVSFPNTFLLLASLYLNVADGVVQKNINSELGIFTICSYFLEN